MEEITGRGIYEQLLETFKSITSEIELDRLVQQITDIGTQVTGAQFGAFFYNVIGDTGDKYLLYTISGVPREAFSKFPNPQNTAVFHPTFSGLGTVRYDDVTTETHYGKSAPHFGMPKGHLPVKSYLATSVMSPVTNEVIGGLFFGHPEAGKFSSRHEELVEGIAVQAAIAMGNAKLFREMKETERVLQNQREQYKSVFQATSDALIIFNERHTVVDANASASEMLATGTSQLIGTSADKIFLNSALLFNGITGLVSSGRKYQGIASIRLNSGETAEVKINATQYYHEGQMQVLLALKRLDAGKVVEQALIKSEEFATTITNVSPATLWMTDDRAQTIYINDTWTEMVGGQTQDHLGMGWLSYIIAEDQDQARQKFQQSFDERKSFSQDFRIRRRDGAIMWCTTSGTPYFTSTGKFGGFAGYLTDITERKKAEQQLSSRNTLINTITNNTLHALFLLDDRQYCTYLNPAAEQMIGFTLAEIQDKPLHYYIHHTHPDGRHFPIEECPIDRALPTRVQTTGEEIFIRRSGEFFPVMFVASPIIENGIAKGTVIEVRDTTEERQIREALKNKDREAMAMLEQRVAERTAQLEKINFELLQFTSVASHDLKEPVRKMAVYSDRAKDLARDYKNEKFQTYLDNIIRSSNRMTALINDLLSYTSISQGNLESRDVDLNELITQIIDDLEISILEKNATFKIGSLPTIEGVEMQLGQVFQNLISNSLKFSDPARTPVINISSERASGGWRIIYSDNGIGFDNSMAEKIFELFERLHSTQQYQGTGLGLAIVRKIVNLHNGEIHADSIPDKGTTFTIFFPG